MKRSSLVCEELSWWFWASSLVAAVILSVAVVAVSRLYAQSPYTLGSGGTSLRAAAGDGTVCNLAKIAGAAPALAVSCVGPSISTTSTLSAVAGAAGFYSFQAGDVACAAGLNPTAAVVTIGSLGAVPANAAVIGCSVNVRTAGKVSSTQQVPLQTLAWP